MIDVGLDTSANAAAGKPSGNAWPVYWRLCKLALHYRVRLAVSLLFALVIAASFGSMLVGVGTGVALTFYEAPDNPEPDEIDPAVSMAGDIRAAADEGNARAQRARDFLAGAVRDWIGTYFFGMGGADRIVFTAGIGENDADMRAKVLSGLEEVGIVLDPAKNESAEKGERRISADDSRTEVWVIPANEEWVVARETRRFIQNRQ